jgi:D-beta-D-heptose 7-phosphate kinase/D-beta-D-heptose 1-phosphate adenosyltransferase
MGGTDWRAVLFTLGPDGMVLAERDKEVERIPARVREVFDVTGAGDTVVAALSLALAAGAPLGSASALANLAAGIVVGKVGTAVCSSDELAAALSEGGHGA